MYRKLSLIALLTLASCQPAFAQTKFRALASGALISSATQQVVTVNPSGPDVLTSVAPSASIDTTNASNIATGTLSGALLPSPFTNGTASGNTSKFALVSGSIATGCLGGDASGNIIASACTSGAGGGTVTSFSAGDFGPLFSASVANSTTTPALSFSALPQNPNLGFMGPIGGAAANPTFRALVSTDLPNPSATGKGGVFSLASSAHLFINLISTNGAPGAAQPAFSDLLGSSSTSQLPVISCSTLSNAATSCSTDATNFANDSGALVSGTTATTQAAADNTTKVATDAYVTTAVNNAIAAVNPAVAVQAATTSASNTSGFTYNNGASGIGATFTGAVNTALTVDGYTFTALGQRLLVKNDTQSPSGAFNGIYYVTQVQTAILPLILTRALDYDMPSDINNTGAIPVINGTVNGTTTWVETAQVTTVGTDPLTYAQFSYNPSNIVTSWTGASGFSTNSASTGAVTETLANQNPNLGLFGPVGGAATAPAFRALVSTDLPNPGAAAKGGVMSLASVSSKWIDGIGTNGLPDATQPNFTDLLGSSSLSQLPSLAQNKVWLGSATTIASAAAIPSCPDSAGNHLNFTSATGAFSCGTTGGSSGGSGTVDTGGAGQLAYYSAAGTTIDPLASSANTIATTDGSGNIVLSSTLASTKFTGAILVSGTASGTLSNGLGAIYASTGKGLVLQGQGSTNDISILAAGGTVICQLGHGTVNMACTSFEVDTQFNNKIGFSTTPNLNPIMQVTRINIPIASVNASGGAAVLISNANFTYSPVGITMMASGGTAATNSGFVVLCSTSGKIITSIPATNFISGVAITPWISAAGASISYASNGMLGCAAGDGIVVSNNGANATGIGSLLINMPFSAVNAR